MVSGWEQERFVDKIFLLSYETHTSGLGIESHPRHDWETGKMSARELTPSRERRK